MSYIIQEKISAEEWQETFADWAVYNPGWKCGVTHKTPEEAERKAAECRAKPKNAGLLYRVVSETKQPTT